MSETPDFDQIARATAKPHCNRWDEDSDGNQLELGPSEDDLTADIAEQLRKVWNARGAADAQKVNEAVEEIDVVTRIWLIETIRGEDR